MLYEWWGELYGVVGELYNVSVEWYDLLVPSKRILSYFVNVKK